MLFGAIARARSAMYTRRLLPSYDVGTPVISVGNVVAGGTGKTPMIVWLAKELKARGRTPGIISRGYRAPGDFARGASHERERGDGNRNDEARMLDDMLPGVLHVQNRDRVAAARQLAEVGVDAILVDDGFQHRRLARDVDIVLVDALRPFGLPAPPEGGEPVRAFLPRGLMREPLVALQRADAIVLTRVDTVSGETLERLEALLGEAAPGVPLVHSQHRPTCLREAGTLHSLGELRGAEVDLFSGIGNPGAFERTVHDLGGKVISHRAFGDHHAFRPEDLAGLGVDRPALTTAKDAARLTLQAEVQPEIQAPPRLWVLDVELAIVENEAALSAILDRLPESDAGRMRASIHGGLHG
ncbi:Tetraacyldisaccharide 4'-kinase [Planctomycetes bacterium Poly30]|uniref:Tetraacyldisaccharide 4'-kinase n=2 Tax=Saltatorellus ferox TaxID=2528018 RepID=A0A518ER78_9BACT|nr:Tetraacyldisaccharide 4'-kinase [Planctomycetes bacterium Poly30]